MTLARVSPLAASAVALLLLATCASTALAEDTALEPFGGEPLAKLPGSLTVGGFTFRPLVEVRTRAEVWSEGTLGGALSPLSPTIKPTLATHTDALIAERSRLGIAAERGPVSAVIVLQDARQFGAVGSSFDDSHELPVFEPHEAYLDLHTKDRQVFFRAGRQEIELGDGRLVGISDQSSRGRSLDAIRLGFRVKNLDVQAFASVLNLPHLSGDVTNFGTELYALDLTWRASPWFAAELAGLARISRGTDNPAYTPSNTFVPWIRIFGDRRGFGYSVTGALEAGNIAYIGGIRNQLAGAVAGEAHLETALPWRFTVGVEGAYATGRDRTADAATTDHGFDPILPDSSEHFGESGFVAWSNLIEAGAHISITPKEWFRFQAGYRFAGMADPKGEWFTSELHPVGSAKDNTSIDLGHIIEGNIQITPWEKQFAFMADYGAMVLGEAGKQILVPAGANQAIIQYALLQAKVILP